MVWHWSQEAGNRIPSRLLGGEIGDFRFFYFRPRFRLATLKSERFLDEVWKLVRRVDRHLARKMVSKWPLCVCAHAQGGVHIPRAGTPPPHTHEGMPRTRCPGLARSCCTPHTHSARVIVLKIQASAHCWQHRAHPSLTPTPGASRHRHTNLAQFACRLEHSKALCLPGRTGGPRARACVGWDGRQHCAGHALLRRRVPPHAHTTMPPRPGAFWACRVVVVVGAGCPHAMERNVGSKPRPASMRYQCRRCGCAGAASATRDISGTPRQTLPRQPAAQRQ